MKTVIFFLLLTTVLSGNSHSFGRYNNREQSQLRKNCLFNMCQSVSEYPKEKMHNIIANNTVLQSYFGTVYSSADHLESRKNRQVDTSCESTKQMTIFPKMLKDVNDVERIIVNVDPYQQSVDFELCDKCLNITLDHIKMQCVQKFKLVKLATINVGSEEMEFRNFQVPSHCAYTCETDDV